MIAPNTDSQSQVNIKIFEQNSIFYLKHLQRLSKKDHNKEGEIK